MANNAIFTIDVPGLEKLQEAGNLWKGISKGGKSTMKVGVDSAKAGMGMAFGAWKKALDADSAMRQKINAGSKKLWEVSRSAMTNFTRSLMGWSKWAVAGVLGGAFGLKKLAEGVRSNMYQGRATGTNTATIMAWEKAFQDVGFGGEGAGTNYLRAIREMQTDLQKQAYFANLGMRTGPGIKGESTEAIALEFMRKLRESKLPASMKDEMAAAVGLNRLDLESKKAGEFETLLSGAKDVTKVSESTAQKMANFALQLDRLTTSIKTNFINLMGKYANEITGFVATMNEYTDRFAKYVLSGELESDLKAFGYELIHWMNKYLPGVNIKESKESKQYFSAKMLKESSEKFAEEMAKIPSNKHFEKIGPEQKAETIQLSLWKLQEAINKSDATREAKMKVVESAAQAADKALGSRVNFQFTVSGESSANVTLKALPISNGATPYKRGN